MLNLTRPIGLGTLFEYQCRFSRTRLQYLTSLWPNSYLLRLVKPIAYQQLRRASLIGNTEARKAKVVVITGPTAVGKTDVSLLIAEKLNGEIISADSVQVYRGLDVGSAKVLHAESVFSRKGFLWHCLELSTSLMVCKTAAAAQFPKQELC